MQQPKILLTGATGYIGKRLLPVLIEQGCFVYCMVRDTNRFICDDAWKESVAVVEADLLEPATLENLPKDIDAAYYLVHSMTSSATDFDELEAQAAENFKGYLQQSNARQVVYLSGLVNDESLSKHLASRKQVENILKGSGVPLTVLRAAIIIGSGSASFEIIRDLVEKLPIMIAPRWLNTKNQPIAISNVLQYLTAVLLNNKAYSNTFDIGGPDILTYKEMLLEFARVRNLSRLIITVPVLTPKLSARWLFLVTSTPYNLAKNLVDSMKNEAVCKEQDIKEIVRVDLLGYVEAVERAFLLIEQNSVVSSWIDAVQSEKLNKEMTHAIQIPTHGCFVDVRQKPIKGNSEKVLERVWTIGGKTGWYYGNWLWRIRGLIDKLIGGVGLRRGRRHPSELNVGDALDFWRVLLADKGEGRLLLYAEMRLPGDAWLEFSINPETQQFNQKATFRPRGVFGRLYWYVLLPVHNLMFEGMARRIVRG